MLGKYIARCPYCGTTWEFEGYEILLEPYPHGECEDCGNWVPLF